MKALPSIPAMAPLPIHLLWLCFLLITPLFLLRLIKNRKGFKLHLPPSPFQLPILGNVHQIGSLPHQSFAKLSRKYGPVMLLKFGCKPAIIISSAEAAKQVLKFHDLDSCSRAEIASIRKLTYNYVDLGFAPYGKHWRQIRKTCVLELFSLKRVQSFGFIREEEVGLLMESLFQSSCSETPVDISQKIFALTGSIVFRMAFGQRFQGSGLDNREFQGLVHEAEAVMGGFNKEECFPYIGWIFDWLSGYHSNLEKLSVRLDTFFEKAIDDHVNPEKRKIEDREDIIDVLLNVQKHQTEFDEARLLRNHIKGVLLVI